MLGTPALLIEPLQHFIIHSQQRQRPWTVPLGRTGKLSCVGCTEIAVETPMLAVVSALAGLGW